MLLPSFCCQTRPPCLVPFKCISNHLFPGALITLCDPVNQVKLIHAGFFALQLNFFYWKYIDNSVFIFSVEEKDKQSHKPQTLHLAHCSLCS